MLGFVNRMQRVGHPMRRLRSPRKLACEQLEGRLLLSGLDDAYEDNDSKAIVDSRPEGVPNSPNLGSLTAPLTISGLQLQDSAD